MKSEENNDRKKYINEMELLFRQLIRQFKKDLNNLFVEHSLTSSEFLILNFLDDNNPQKLSVLSENFQVSASHITAITDRLLLKNLVQRKRSEKDRRVVELLITKEGKLLVEKMEEKKQRYTRKKFADLTTEQLIDCIEAFKKLI